MQQFFYEAVDATGKTVVGKIEGKDASEVHRRLQQQGYRPISLAPASPNSSLSSALDASQLVGLGTAPVSLSQESNAPFVPRASASTHMQGVGNASHKVVFTGNAGRLQASAKSPAVRPSSSSGSKLGGVSTHDLLVFFQQFATLVLSGYTLYNALEELGRRTPNKHLGQVIREMMMATQAGRPISEVMKRYPRIFPEHVTGAVAAGELGGFLDVMLPEIAQTYEQNIALYRGSWLPKLLVISALFSVAIVIPFFPSLFSSMDYKVGLALYLKRLAFLYLPAAVGLLLLAVSIGRWMQLPEYRRYLDALALRTPPFGLLQRQFSLACFTRTLRRLYHAGVAPGTAWESAAAATPNAIIRERLLQAAALMQRGAAFPDAFQATRLFTGQIENLILTGHQAGRVPESLDQVADYYQNLVLDSTGKVRHAMLHIGITAMLVLGGGAFLWFVYSYFNGMFHFVDKYFGS
ncbi:type II secretory pathway, component PulF [Chthonomonas calidirosea]|uniref:Type II secretory pathway, component PulF n=1 Tax=Chthonomonas calidirosea (strain DSM 23976 / ICMP 18418 / T49) TaxID=1303518 RepID=S0EXG4_CHTCT|nr:type II secretion system F family protein [Chthonomonas calidirosea]CCW36601.1 Type II secretory pathway, component PulF [Chthonomonas calidirosea T49]CEK15742.1 type II secretory pathway, component PulF [Chthonomonas calidirosea]CEK15750.1 type II secretory pathway, component PulF [Chthonomonas calidirosea]CEK16843.1 type II secretory pathway, component PulF [Chthonomonas calidirosea]